MRIEVELDKFESIEKLWSYLKSRFPNLQSIDYDHQTRILALEFPEEEILRERIKQVVTKLRTELNLDARKIRRIRLLREVLEEYEFV